MDAAERIENIRQTLRVISGWKPSGNAIADKMWEDQEKQDAMSIYRMKYDPSGVSGGQAL